MVCECENSNDPLCGFCADDLYCPQCGHAITRVFSKYERRSDDADGRRSIWIYQNPGTGAFEFALSAVGYGARREEIRGYPRLDIERSWLRESVWFDRTLDEGAIADDQESRSYVLRNERSVGGATADPGLSIRESGEVLPLTVCGPFQNQIFELRVCRAPEFAVTLSGSGILDAGSLTHTHWQVWKRAELRVRLTIEALTAPVCLSSELRIEAASFPDGAAPRLETTLVGGAEIWPGEPVSVDMVLDTRGWTAEQEFKFVLHLPLNGCEEFAQEHTLEMISAGNLRFNSDWLSISDELHFGEKVRLTDQKRPWTPVVVTNDGDQTVYVEPPEVVVKAGPTDQEWLRAEWADGLFHGQRRALQPRDSVELALTVDLSRMTAAHLPAPERLRAGVVFWDRQRDEPRQWDLTVILNDVRERPTYKHDWLAIDFGSTNSYAAIMDASGRIVPVLASGAGGAEYGDEQFPTTIFFQDVSQRDRPKYLIGHEAEAAGVECPTAVVHGMKRWIGVSEGKTWRVRDPLRNEAEFTVEELVRLYLREVIRRCEFNRRARVSNIGLSFPANFDHRRIARLNDIAQVLAVDLTSETPTQPFKCDPPRIDEATAVTLGFTLTPEILEGKIEPLLQQRGEVVIAAFDFGGGTIDTALIRIGSDNPDLIFFADFHSKYLGIGGDENFGGENVTLAFLELLRKRVVACLSASDLGKSVASLRLPIDPPGQGHASLESRTNYDALWAAAEQLKIFQCRETSNAPPFNSASGGDSSDRDARDESTSEEGSLTSTDATRDDLPSHVGSNAASAGVEAAFAAGNNFADATGSLNREVAQVQRARLDTHLSLQLQRLSIEYDSDSRTQKRKLADDEALQTALDAAIANGSLLVSLREVYDYRIESDLRGESNLKVLERLQKCVEEMTEFRNRAKVDVDFVVLAGASSRLPIVEQLWRKAFPKASLEFDRVHPKSKVAAGLARFLQLQAAQPERVKRVACRTDYTSAPIGIVEPSMKRFWELIEACTDAAESDRWFPLASCSKPLPLQRVWVTSPTRSLHLYEKLPEGPRPFGWFDLSQPLLDSISPRTVFYLRFAEGIERMELKVVDGEREVGVWPMIPFESEDRARS